MEASQRLVKRFAGAVERSTSYSSTQECTTKAMGSGDSNLRRMRLHPRCAKIGLRPSCKCLGEYGGDDGTRTRGLCRDRVAFRWNLVIWNGTDNPPAESQRIDRRSFLDPDRTRIRDFPACTNPTGQTC